MVPLQVLELDGLGLSVTTVHAAAATFGVHEADKLEDELDELIANSGCAWSHCRC